MSLRRAINDKCRECIYDPADSGNWRQQVTACTATECPLFPYRPRSTAHPANRANSGDFGGKLDEFSKVQ